jgi:hypothetical protein
LERRSLIQISLRDQSTVEQQSSDTAVQITVP